MTPEVRTKIEQIQHGNVPEGYKKGKIGIVPVEWDEVPFSTLFTSTIEYTDDLKKYPLHSLTIEDGITAKTERYERSHLVKKENSYKVVRPNDYAYNPMNIRFGAVARHKGDISVSVSGYYDIFTTIHESDLVFMDSFLTCGPMITYYNKVSTGSLIEKQRVHFSDFLEFSLALPPLEERKKIAEILTTQDKVIELEQQKIEEIKKVKKFFLSKMFPKKGQAVPEIRFKGFTDAWEQRKFAEIVETRRGLTYKPSDICENGVRVLRSSNIDDDSFVLRDDDVFVKAEAVNIDYTKENDILITAANGSSRLVGKHAIIGQVSPKSTVHGGFMLLGATKEPYFVNASMSSSWYRHFNELFVAGGNGTIGNLNKNDLDNQGILVPSEEERQKIGAFFKQLDHLITLHQRKLEEEKQKKKALMQLLLMGIVRV